MRPSMRVSGYMGARAMRSPPNPQPISANSTFLIVGDIVVDQKEGGLQTDGKCTDQSIAAGDEGLEKVKISK